MGKSVSKYALKYFRNFNIENKAYKQIDKMENNVALKTSPRHPSTAHIFKKIEGDTI